MINNYRSTRPRRGGSPVAWPAPTIVLAVVLAACQRSVPREKSYQGVVEFDERVLGFEMGGRLKSLDVTRGSLVRKGDVLARLDDTLERSAQASRQAETEAARADLALVKAGGRPEQIRSLQAQIRGMESSEALLQKNLAREKELLSRGAVPQASVDDLGSRLENATAQRQSLEQRLSELKTGARRQEVDSVQARVAVATEMLSLQSERVARYELHGPLDGAVLDVHAEVGEVVATGAPVVTLADTTHPYADVFVPEGELNGIQMGTIGLLRVDETTQTFSVRVENVGRKTEFTPRYLFSPQERPHFVVRVRVRIEDPSQKLHAGVPTFVTFDRAAAPAISSAPAKP